MITLFVQNFVNNWPKSWGEVSIGIICLQSAQVALISQQLSSLAHPAIENLLKAQSIIVNSIQNIQGLQFRVSLVSTVFTSYQANLEENTLHNYILSPFAANACLTRCEECLVVFGKQRFLTEVADYFLPFSMQVFWKNYVSLCRKKHSSYKGPFADKDFLYFMDLKCKILENKK